MQKNDKYYTFLLKHSSKNRIFIKRVEISRKSVTLSSVSVLFFAGVSFFVLGIYGIVSNVSGKVDATQMSASVQTAPAETEHFDYSRPGDSKDFLRNSGGPELSDENDSETTEIDDQLKAAALAIPANLRPSIWPHEGKINNEFGFRRNPFGGRAYEFHGGMDIDGERGEQVFAPAGGTVIKAGWSGGYGNMIEIDHGNGLTTRYGHLSKIEIAVGDTITRGQEIGLIGSTGRSTGPHLHYEMRFNDRPVNPRHFLPQESPVLTTK
ncbi:MAG: M23 family metallopeptidase [Acidobacteria bacterium]|nr:M23 family metallopeptidase [Acidobacteriota bacterium]